MAADALTRLRRATVLTWGAGALLVTTALVWAVRFDVQPRLPAIRSPTAQLDTTSGGDGRLVDAGGPSLPGFGRRLSPLPPPAPPKPAQTETAVAFRLQLLGISRDGDRFVAALYDPADDRIHIVRDGEKLGSIEIRHVAEREVELADGSRPRKLLLQAPPAGGSRGTIPPIDAAPPKPAATREEKGS